MKRFTEEHEWVELNNRIATIGITAHAVNELGDITYIELPELGVQFAQGDVLTVVESVKAASDVYSPVTGNICEINNTLEENPEVMNASPEQDGWICRLENVNPDDVLTLMSEEEYVDFVS